MKKASVALYGESIFKVAQKKLTQPLIGE